MPKLYAADPLWDSHSSDYSWLFLLQRERSENVAGLIHIRYREYSPVLQRFMQLDLLESTSAIISPYKFANNDPILFSDPLGLCPWKKSCPQPYYQQPIPPPPAPAQNKQVVPPPQPQKPKEAPCENEIKEWPIYSLRRLWDHVNKALLRNAPILDTPINKLILEFLGVDKIKVFWNRFNRLSAHTKHTSDGWISH
jgi:RHS repeat-associated protein